MTQQRACVATLADTDPKIREIFGIAKTFHEFDPEAPRLEGEAQENLAFADTRSRFFIGTASGVAFGRGDTLSRAHGSEVAWWCLGPKQASIEARSALNVGQLTFRRAKRKQYPVLFLQAYPEDDVECFLTSRLGYFSMDRILALLRTVDESGEKAKAIPGGVEIRWEEPKPGRRYVIGADCSEGIPDATTAS